LLDGSHTVVVRATDQAGNTADKSIASIEFGAAASTNVTFNAGARAYPAGLESEGFPKVCG
jgi:hypothetical protein